MNEDNILHNPGQIHNAVKKAGLKLTGGDVQNSEYHHEEIMDQMIKVIEFTKMDRKMRSVLLLRLIHGFSIQRMQIHLFLQGNIVGNSKDELLMIEAEGKRRMVETLQKYTIQDIISSINAKPGIITGLRNELTNPDLGLS